MTTWPELLHYIMTNRLRAAAWSIMGPELSLHRYLCLSLSLLEQNSLKWLFCLRISSCAHCLQVLMTKVSFIGAVIIVRAHSLTPSLPPSLPPYPPALSLHLSFFSLPPQSAECSWTESSLSPLLSSLWSQVDVGERCGRRRVEFIRNLESVTVARRRRAGAEWRSRPPELFWGNLSVHHGPLE